MATFKAQIDSGWASSTLTLVALRSGASLGTASATLSTVQSVTVATATIDLSAAGAGVVDLVLRDASGNVAWTDSQEINAAGAVVDIDGYTQPQAMRLILAAMAGRVAGAGTTTNQILAADGSKTRITATVDSNGNRSSLSLDAD